MEKRVLAAGLFFLSALSACVTPPFIVVKNPGKINGEVFMLNNPRVYFKSSFWYGFATDTVKLSNKSLPDKYKRYLYDLDKQNAKLILGTDSRTTGWGEFFLIQDAAQKEISQYSLDVARALNKKFRLKNTFYEPQFDIAEYDRRTDSLWSAPSDFMKHTKINLLTYDLYKNKDSFAIIEAHFYIPEQKTIWRAIHSFDIVRRKKNLDLPQTFRWQLRNDLLNWIDHFDTVAPKEPKKLVVDPQNIFVSVGKIYAASGYIAALDSLTAWKDYFTRLPDFQQRSMYHQAFFTFASFGGDNQNALRYEALAFPRRKIDTFIHLSRDIKAVNAMEYISKKYGSEQVVMMNEKHDRGQSRDFARQLLPYLYKQGFRYFAAEVIDAEDTLLNKRGYAINKTGYYTSEPVFGQLLRAARDLGYQLTPYESQADSTDYKLSAAEGRAKREENQAKNIMAILEKDKNAKIMVYAGHGHINKRPSGEWIFMGERLSDKLHHDVPSIECTVMMEGFERKDENPIYVAAVDSFPSREPFVLLKNDTPYISPDKIGCNDFHVFLPRTNYDLGYPNWMKETNETYYEFTVNKELKGAFLQVYRAAEWEAVKKEATPVMQFIIPENKDALRLYLKKGKHYLFIKKNGQTLIENTFIVH